MGLRFRKSINIGKLFRINLSKSGIGYSWGFKGFRNTTTSTGKKRKTYSIPGTGISYVDEKRSSKQKKAFKKSEDEGNEMKSKKKRKIAPIILGFLVLAGIGGAFNDDSKDTTEPQSQIQSLADTESEKPEVQPVEQEEPAQNSVAVLVPPITETTPSEVPQEQEKPSANVEASTNEPAQTPTVVVTPVTENAETPNSAEVPQASEQVAEKTVFLSENGTKYHRESCRTLKDYKKEVTLSDAINAGYEACKVCNPPIQ